MSETEPELRAFVERLDEQPNAAPAADDWQWAIVEVFGHRRHAGRTREEERFGAKMLRIDVPVDGDPAKGWNTIYYGGGSIFSFSLTDEATVRRINKPYERPSLTRIPREVEVEPDSQDGEFTL